ncbi:hypothetical protein AB835_07100 [Candidatus Endobugula sertula]|uniref:Uncharacterized protein n=1 Tax=Candidatus Endobugula sertula TaxID=62101 RepID=A0A1D2QQ94_9GAMM|nr:hypothetical protein AB835_07100 [Candidatus Endobugula sertula]
MSQQLIRKQFLVSSSNVNKIERLAEEKGTSATEIVRLAIDAFDPEGVYSVNSNDLMTLVADQLKEAISSTQRANKKVAQTLKSLEEKKH